MHTKRISIKPIVIIIITSFLYFDFGCDTNYTPQDTDVESDITQSDAHPYDGSTWTWDDSKIGHDCETIYSDCGQGNICLANVTCEPSECTKWDKDTAGYYKCHRKCTSDAHCNSSSQHCVAIMVGDNDIESDQTCLSICGPLDWLEGDLEYCRIIQSQAHEIRWPPANNF
jgi:hypothetical protein